MQWHSQIKLVGCAQSTVTANFLIECLIVFRVAVLIFIVLITGHTTHLESQGR